jgi:hypothetical protein
MSPKSKNYEYEIMNPGGWGGGGVSGRAFLARASPVLLRQLPVPVASLRLWLLSRGRQIVCQLVALCADERPYINLLIF